MKNFYGDRTWKLGDPIPGLHIKYFSDSWIGSTEWRQSCSENLGPDVFFEKMVSSENPMLAFLRRKHKLSEMKELKLSPFVLYNCFAAVPYIEQLVRSFDVLPLELLQEEKADFQVRGDATCFWPWKIILKHWKNEYESGNPVTLFKLITGLYDGVCEAVSSGNSFKVKWQRTPWFTN